MIRWIPYTFIRIVLFFIGGIVLGIYQPEAIQQTTAQVLLITLVIVYLVSFFVTRFFNKSAFNLGYAGLPAVFLAGYVHLLIQTDSRNPDHLVNVTEPIHYYTAVITSYSEEKERSWKTEAEVQEVYTNAWKKRQGKIILYFSKEAFALPYQYGDVLLIKGRPQATQPPSNPGAFDYRRFLSFRNIYHQHFLRAGNVELAGNDPPNTVIHFAIRARVWADQTLKRFVRGAREQAIASALVLGVTDGLDNELLNAYAATGAMHVLAVSGLHISIIYMILLWILKPLQRVRSGTWILALVSLIILWAYAFITGLSPSVLRAVTMFSFIAVARPAGQGTNIYNTLAASAFCLLMVDPFLIMSVGFQLSYLAVLGIVYLQPVFYQLWEPRRYLWDQAWKITCVSIAAQIATFALGLLYFHQFPNYFLVSNLLVIPGSFFVLVSGIAVLATSFIQAVAGIVGVILTGFIKAMNFVVFTVEAFPFSRIENIHISVAQCWLLMTLMVIFILLLKYKRFSYSLAAGAVVVFFSVFQWKHFNEKINLQKITIYNIYGHSAIDLIDRGHAYFISDSSLIRDTGKLRFHVHPNRLLSGITKVINDQHQPFIREFPGGKVIAWNRKILIHLSRKKFTLPEHLHPDYIVIGNNAVYDLAQLPELPSRIKIILDSSNSYFYTERILEQAKTKNLAVYSVLHQGAFDFTIGT